VYLILNKRKQTGKKNKSKKKKLIWNLKKKTGIIQGGHYHGY